uniref:Uncharacterized protein n=1 Tax=Rhizophora mucronata TaxID=61149 RepID=A0A2P2QCP8_RHIMU
MAMAECVYAENKVPVKELSILLSVNSPLVQITISTHPSSFFKNLIMKLYSSKFLSGLKIMEVPILGHCAYTFPLSQ